MNKLNVKSRPLNSLININGIVYKIMPMPNKAFRCDANCVFFPGNNTLERCSAPFSIFCYCYTQKEVPIYFKKVMSKGG